MKKLLLSSNLLLLSIILFLAFQKKNAPAAEQPPYQTCIDCGETDFTGVAGGDLLDAISRYGTTHSSIINRQPYPARHGIKDGRACWFPIDTLKKFICLVEKYSKNLNLNSSDLGIRFYYGVYGDSASHIWDKAYASQHTLFMVPTYNDKSTSYDIDFDPRFSCTEKINAHVGLTDAFPIKDMAQVITQGKKVRRLLIIASTSVSGQNQGHMCPPTCPGGTTQLLKTADSLHIDYTN